MRDPAKNAVSSCPTLHVSIHMHVTISSTYYKHSAIQLLCLKEVWSAIAIAIMKLLTTIKNLSVVL